MQTYSLAPKNTTN